MIFVSPVTTIPMQQNPADFPAAKLLLKMSEASGGDAVVVDSTGTLANGALKSVNAGTETNSLPTSFSGTPGAWTFTGDNPTTGQMEYARWSAGTYDAMFPGNNSVMYDFEIDMTAADASVDTNTRYGLIDIGNPVATNGLFVFLERSGGAARMRITVADGATSQQINLTGTVDFDSIGRARCVIVWDRTTGSEFVELWVNGVLDVRKTGTDAGSAIASIDAANSSTMVMTVGYSPNNSTIPPNQHCGFKGIVYHIRYWIFGSGIPSDYQTAVSELNNNSQAYPETFRNVA